MKKRTTIYLDEKIHKEAKKRIVDLDISFSEYITKLIKPELSVKFLDNQSPKQQANHEQKP